MFLGDAAAAVARKATRKEARSACDRGHGGELFERLCSGVIFWPRTAGDTEEINDGLFAGGGSRCGGGEGKGEITGSALGREDEEPGTELVGNWIVSKIKTCICWRRGCWYEAVSWL